MTWHGMVQPRVSRIDSLSHSSLTSQLRIHQGTTTADVQAIKKDAKRKKKKGKLIEDDGRDSLKSDNDLVGSTLISAVSSAAKSSPLSSLPPIASSKFPTPSTSILGSLPPVTSKILHGPPPKTVKAAESTRKSGSEHFEIEADPFLDEGESVPKSLPGTSIVFKEEKFQDLGNNNGSSLVGNLLANPTFGDEVKVVKLGDKEKKKKKKKMKAMAQVVPVDDNNEGVVTSSKDGNTATLSSVQVVKVDEEEAGFHKQQQEKQMQERHQNESSKKRYDYIKYFIGGVLCILLGVGLVFLVQSTQTKSSSTSSTATSAQGVVAIGNGDNSSSSTGSAAAGSSSGTSASPSPNSPSVIFGTNPGNNTSSPTLPKSQSPTNSSLRDSFYTTDAYQMAVLAGSSQGNEGFLDAAGTKALFHFPVGLCVDSSSLSSGGVTRVADSENNVIRRIDSLGVVQTVAGSLKPGSQDGQREKAGFAWPTSVATDFRGALYIADMGNNQIRKMNR